MRGLHTFAARGGSEVTFVAMLNSEVQQSAALLQPTLLATLTARSPGASILFAPNAFSSVLFDFSIHHQKNYRCPTTVRPKYREACSSYQFYKAKRGKQLYVFSRVRKGLDGAEHDPTFRSTAHKSNPSETSGHNPRIRGGLPYGCGNKLVFLALHQHGAGVTP